MTPAFARNWWTLVVRGLAAVAFGVLTLFRPGISVIALIALFASYALVDGIFNVVGAVKGMKQHERWGLLLTEGLVSIGVGVATFVWPGLTALALLLWIAVWAIVTGALEIGAAIELRRVIRHEWLMALAGVASIAFGVLLVIWPGPGALTVLALIGAYAIVFGGLLIGLGFRVRAWDRQALPPGEPHTRIPVAPA